MADPISVEDQSDRYYYDTTSDPPAIRLKPEFKAFGTESLDPVDDPTAPDPGTVAPDPLAPPPPPPGQATIGPDIPASAGVSGPAVPPLPSDTDPTPPDIAAPVSSPSGPPPDSPAGPQQDSGPSLEDRVDYLYRRFGIQFPDPNAPEPGGTGVTAPPA